MHLKLSERAQGMVEYALILILVTVVVIAGLQVLGVINSDQNSETAPQPTATPAPLSDVFDTAKNPTCRYIAKEDMRQIEHTGPYRGENTIFTLNDWSMVVLDGWVGFTPGVYLYDNVDVYKYDSVPGRLLKDGEECPPGAKVWGD